MAHQPLLSTDELNKKSNERTAKLMSIGNAVSDSMINSISPSNGCFISATHPSVECDISTTEATHKITVKVEVEITVLPKAII